MPPWFAAPHGDGPSPWLNDASLAKAEREAFEDILWALVNTKEFLFNH